MPPVLIHSTKYNGTLHWRYEAPLLEEAEWGWLTFLPAGQPVETHKGTWLSRHPALRWHWRDRWWDALLLFDESGRWLEWYCNIVTPPRLAEGVLRFHDLDLDVVWHREHGLQITDTDEFERHALQMGYPRSIIQRAWENAQQVRRLIQEGAWRFAEDPYRYRLADELARHGARSLG